MNRENIRAIYTTQIFLIVVFGGTAIYTAGKPIKRPSSLHIPHFLLSSAHARLVAALHGIARKRGETCDQKTVIIHPFFFRADTTTLQKKSWGGFFDFGYSSCLPVVHQQLPTNYELWRNIAVGWMENTIGAVGNDYVKIPIDVNKNNTASHSKYNWFQAHYRMISLS